MIKNKKILIVGGACSGKDYLATRLAELHGFTFGVFSTSRPPRKNEINGEHYHFLTDKEFNTQSKEMVVLAHWREWGYGLKEIDWITDSVFIFTPAYLDQLSKEE